MVVAEDVLLAVVDEVAAELGLELVGLELTAE